MGILSDSSILKKLIPKQEIQKGKKWYQERNWNEINKRILIDPFDEANLGTFSYDLHLGEEAYSVNERKKTVIAETGLICKPNDILLILSMEYIGIPRSLVASILPRFSLVRKGLQLSMTKIDSTWYGRIAVALINQSTNQILLERDRPFCTLVLHELSEPCSRILSAKNTRALGRESIDYFIEENQ